MQMGIYNTLGKKVHNGGGMDNFIQRLMCANKKMHISHEKRKRTTHQCEQGRFLVRAITNK